MAVPAGPAGGAVRKGVDAVPRLTSGIRLPGDVRTQAGLVLLAALVFVLGTASLGAVGAPAGWTGSGAALAGGAAETSASSAGPVLRPGDGRPVELTENDLLLLARLINGEARGEPYLGHVAVGAVVVNRLKSDEFPDTVAGVVYQPGQFAVVADGQINLEPSESCLEAARAAAAGEDPTGGALYFWRPDRTWNDYLWSRPLKAVIGQHRFTE
ncbi:MAG: cell wall hydrolase [Firmicutes bacterium]|nr:cell wall hydrolase [Bacillota bacterium]